MILWTASTLQQPCLPLLQVLVTNPWGSLIGLDDASDQNRLIVMAAILREFLQMRADSANSGKIGPDFHTFAWILARKIELGAIVDNRCLSLILQTLGETAKESQLLHPFESSEIYKEFIDPLIEVLGSRNLKWGEALVCLRSVSALCFSTTYPATGFENVR